MQQFADELHHSRNFEQVAIRCYWAKGIFSYYAD